MNARKSIFLSVVAVALAAPGLSFATAAWHPAAIDTAESVHPDLSRSTKTRAEVLQELQAAIGSASHLNGNSKCKTCAPCCVGAALTSDVSTPVAASVSEAVFPALTVVSPYPPVGSLDRPPQTILS